MDKLINFVANILVTVVILSVFFYLFGWALFGIIAFVLFALWILQ